VASSGHIVPAVTPVWPGSPRNNARPSSYKLLEFVNFFLRQKPIAFQNSGGCFLGVMGNGGWPRAIPGPNEPVKSDGSTERDVRDTFELEVWSVAKAVSTTSIATMPMSNSIWSGKDNEDILKEADEDTILAETSVTIITICIGAAGWGI